MNQTSFKPEFELALMTAGADRRPVIEIRGELDSGACEELLEAYGRAVAEHGPGKLTLDLRNVTFIDSAGTRAMILVERSAREHGISLLVLRPPQEVTELLRTAGLVEHVELAPQASGASRESEFVERIEVELPPDPLSPSRARAEVREALADYHPAEVANVVLLASELVTNAVVHPRGVAETPVGLRVIRYRDAVRIEVEDGGDGFDREAALERARQAFGSAAPEEDRGRGLFLVESFASRWGTERPQTDAGPRFRVWFEVDWTRPDTAQAAAG